MQCLLIALPWRFIRTFPLAVIVLTGNRLASGTRDFASCILPGLDFIFQWREIMSSSCRYTRMRPRSIPHVEMPTTTIAVSQVAQLCRGLLQPDPVQRQGASEGQSIVAWFVSRLETADRRDAQATAAARSDSDATSRGDNSNVGPPMASGWAGDERMQPGGTYGASTGKRRRDGLAIAPVDMTAPSIPLGSTREFEYRGRDDMMLSEDARQEKSGRGVCAERASSRLDTTMRRAPSEEERRLEEPDELVR